MEIYVSNNQDLLTALALSAGSIDTLFETALINGLSADEQPASGLRIEVIPPLKSNGVQKELPKLKPIQKVVVIENQNMQDLTIQTAGSLEHIFEMALLNGISI